MDFLAPSCILNLSVDQNDIYILSETHLSTHTFSLSLHTHARADNLVPMFYDYTGIKQ